MILGSELDFMETNMLYEKGYISNIDINDFTINNIIQNGQVIYYSKSEREIHSVIGESLDKIRIFLNQKIYEFRLNASNNNRIVINIENDKMGYFILNLLLLESVFNQLRERFVDFDQQIGDLFKDKLNELFGIWDLLTREEIIYVSMFCRQNIVNFGMYISKFEVISRYNLYIKLINKMLMVQSKETFLRGDILGFRKKIAIYGGGRLGLIFAKMIKKYTDVEIVYFIDKNISFKTLLEIPVIEPENLVMYHNYDLIVITPIYDFETICTNISEYTNTLCVSLEEIINE